MELELELELRYKKAIERIARVLCDSGWLGPNARSSQLSRVKETESSHTQNTKSLSQSVSELVGWLVSEMKPTNQPTRTSQFIPARTRERERAKKDTTRANE